MPGKIPPAALRHALQGPAGPLRRPGAPPSRAEALDESFGTVGYPVPNLSRSVRNSLSLQESGGLASRHRGLRVPRFDPGRRASEL